MTIRKKTIFIIGLSFIMLIILLYTLSHFIIIENVVRLEERNVKCNATRALDAFLDKKSVLYSIASDWACWDDTYYFVQNKNRKYIKDNMMSSGFENLNISFMAFINTSNQMSYGKYYSLSSKREIPFPLSLKNYIIKNRKFLYFTDIKYKKGGVILLHNGPMLIASWPIFTSEYNGPVQGMMVVGMELNSKVIMELAEKTHLSLSLHTLDDEMIPEDVKKSLYSLKEEPAIIVKPLDEKNIAAYVLLKDIKGSSSLILKSVEDRDIYNQGQADIFYLFISLVTIGIVFFIMILFFLNKTILSRMAEISNSIYDISRNGNISERLSVTGNDELSKHATAINIMLEELEKNQGELNKAIMNSITAQIAVIDKSGTIKAVNESWERFYHENQHLKLISTVGTNYLDLWKIKTGELPDENPEVITGIQSVINGSEKHFTLEYSFNLPSEKRWFLLNVTPLYIKGGGTVISRIDITERKLMEQQLQQAHKLEAIGTLAGGIAHDFNNILGAIIGYTEMSIRETEKGTSLRNNLEHIFKGGKRAKNLVKQILTFTHQEEQEKINIHLEPIIEEVFKLLKASLPSTIQIIYSVEAQKDTILGDPTQIHQILMNLSTNAAHSMKEKGGTLEVKLEEIEVENESQVPDLIPGPYIILSVKDTGHGIRTNIIEKIFDPFFTTKEHGEGTGLGLSVVHGIVKSHGGAIRVNSAEGTGTVFQVFLPLINEPAADSASGELRAIPTGKGRILFVDDEEDLVCLNQELLSALGYKARGTTKSKDALDLFSKEEFDLVITDYTMPGMTGIELTREMIKIRPDIPIILCTGFNDATAAERMEIPNIKAVITKPCSLPTLGETVRKALMS